MKPLLKTVLIAAFAGLAACADTETDDNIAAAAGEQAEGMAAQAGNEVEALGDAIQDGAAELRDEVDPGRNPSANDPSANEVEPANAQ